MILIFYMYMIIIEFFSTKKKAEFNVDMYIIYDQGP